MSRHAFCVSISLFGLASPPATGQQNPNEQVRAVRSRTFDIDYAVNEAAMPLTAVELWYTQDQGQSWTYFGPDNDRHSPARFQAPQEGLFGFFFVMKNTTGPSSGPPVSGETPHLWAFVDFTPPVVQLHAPRISTSLGEQVVQIRWTAIDTQFPSRPVRIQYKAAAASEWVDATAEPLSNTGRYDWRLLDKLTGPIAIRTIVTDRGGNSAVSDEQVIQIDEPVIEHSKPLPKPPPEAEIALPGSRRAQEQVAVMLAQARDAADRGRTDTAIAKLREVVRLEPQRTDAFVTLGDLLRQSGNLDRAMHAYEIALQQRPQHRDALLGSSLVLREQREYEPAAGRLRTILRYAPDDAEAWMILGDVAVFQGNELLARDCYRRATRIDPAATQVINDAQQRLAIMAKASGRGIDGD